MKNSAIIALLLTLIADPAVAQRQMEAETGSLAPVPRRAWIADSPRLSEKDRARMTMAQFARCTVDREPGRVKQIASLLVDKLTSSDFTKVADDECLMEGRLSFQPILLRGALFVELYRRRNNAEMHHANWRFPVVPFDVRVSVDPLDAYSANEIALLAFAKCVIDRDSVTAKAVVIEPTASKAQDAAINTLVPNLGPCLPNGQKITLSKDILEGALGEVLYRGTVPTVRSASQEAK